ncbi:MAG: sulfite exporter TauE/SafE family protein [Chloroflexota bacterium]
MLILGLLLGFVGLGGAGFVAALLIILFQMPVHLSFGTALGAMFVSAAAGGWSHLREGNVDPVAGAQVGLVGVLGAYLGGGLALATDATQLKTFAGLTLILNAIIVYFRTRTATVPEGPIEASSLAERWWRELPGSAAVGFLCGFGSGFLSIGTAPWIQVGLLLLKGMDLRRIVGTTMFALSLMSLTGAIRFAQGGQVSPALLVSVILGLSTGTFLGAKFTKRAPRWLVRGAMIVTPVMAGSLLLAAPA